MMNRIGFTSAWHGLAIAVPSLLAGCAWSGYPYPGAAGNPCYFADGRPPAGAAELGPLPDGCSNAVNLGAMVADPHDVEQGKALVPADGERVAVGIAEYQTGKAKPSGAQASGAPAPTGATTGGAQ
jgi:hypothetical protein